jgi:hypothetical protein
MRLGDEKTVRYDPPDVEEWLETQKVSSTSQEVAAGRRFHKVSRIESSEEPNLSRPLRSEERVTNARKPPARSSHDL